MTLNILIIDDKEQKIDALRQVIMPLFSEGKVWVDAAFTIVDARDKMRECSYDLVILDMVIPELEGQEPSRTAGVEFLDEIYDNDDIKRPLQIIGLTEYENEYSEQQEEFKSRLWYLLYYSQSKLEWKSRLKDKLLQLDKMKRSFIESLTNRGKYDIGIICALSEEFEQMQKAFDCEWEDCQLPGLPYNFRRTVVSTRGMRNLRIIAACAEHPGVCATSILATSIYNIAHVEALFMTGITAGFEDRDVLLDDVIIADSVMDYATGKLKEEEDEKGEIHLLKEVSQMSADHSLISKVSSFCRNQDIIDDINDHVRKQNLKDNRTNITPHISKTICGPFVMQSKTLMESLKKDDRKLQALDMEGFGLYLSSYILGCPALWIKSVCDFGVLGKNNSHHMACSYISARFLYEFLREKY